MLVSCVDLEDLHSAVGTSEEPSTSQFLPTQVPCELQTFISCGILDFISYLLLLFAVIMVEKWRQDLRRFESLEFPHDPFLSSCSSTEVLHSLRQYA